jgi:hypothetical protein
LTAFVHDLPRPTGLFVLQSLEGFQFLGRGTAMNPAYRPLMSPRSIRQYDRDYKLDAVERVKRLGGVKRAAETLRISEILLQRWVREARQKDLERAFPGKGRRPVAAGNRDLANPPVRSTP